MGDEISYDKLREIQKAERGTGVIMALPADFYASAARFIARLKAEMGAGFALEKAREFENAVKVVRDIYAIREQKIVLRAIGAARGNNGVAGLTVEEQALYERVKAAVADGSGSLEGLLGGIPQPAAKAESPPALAPAPLAAPQPAIIPGRALKFLLPVPQFVGPSGASLGPFKPGDVSALPEREAELLVKRKLAADA